MSILDFTKPIKCSHKQGQINPALAAAAKEDARKWKAIRVVNSAGRNGNDFIEIRKTFSGIGVSNVLIVVAKDGWTLPPHETRKPDRWGRSTQGLNVRMSMNSPAMMTFEQFEEIAAVVAEAKAILS